MGWNYDIVVKAQVNAAQQTRLGSCQRPRRYTELGETPGEEGHGSFPWQEGKKRSRSNSWPQSGRMARGDGAGSSL